MAEPMRDPRETRDISIKRMIDSYEKNNRTQCPDKKRREFEKYIEKKIMPQVYEDKK
jgi:hypothetical protein